MGLSGWEILIFVAIILLLFGRRIPETMFSLGKGVSEFKKGMTEEPGQVNQPSEPTNIEK